MDTKLGVRSSFANKNELDVMSAKVVLRCVNRNGMIPSVSVQLDRAATGVDSIRPNRRLFGEPLIHGPERCNDTHTMFAIAGSECVLTSRPRR